MTAGILLGAATQASVVVINSPATSYSTITWNDTNSVNVAGHPGTSIPVQNVTPWGGAPNTLPLTTDPFTSDTAQGTISAAVIGGSYSLSLNNVAMTQANLNTGFAVLGFDFWVEFQLDSGGLLSGPAIAPSFAINGTVQNTAGSFASLNGLINYVSVDVSGVATTVGTVPYSWVDNTPGPFSTTVSGTSIPILPTLPANSTLELTGYLNFEVDPANFTANMVPEPTAGVLLGIGGLAMLLRRRRSA